MSEEPKNGAANGNGKKRLDGGDRAESWFAGLPPVRNDGWVNILGGYGTEKDKTKYTTFQPDLIDEKTAEWLWRSNDIGARIVETIPRECMRQGYELNVGDKELAEDITAEAEEKGVSSTFVQAKEYERAYGGAAIWPIINDQQKDLTQPLNEDRIPEIEHFQVFQPRELKASSWYTEPRDKKYGYPRTYRLQPQTRGGNAVAFDIHESRLIIFPGVRVSRQQMSATSDWAGDSVFCRVFQVLADYGISWTATAVLMHEFSQAEFRMKGLAELMAADRDDVIKARIRAAAMSKSVLNAILMDENESFHRITTSIAGLPELLDKFAVRVAAAADMPVTLLMGQSPAGLNATGESDIRFFYDRVAQIQIYGVLPQLERLYYMFLRSNGGPTRGKEPENWSVKFKALWQPTEKEVADTRYVIAQTDALNIQSGMYSPEEASLSHYGGDTYSPEIVIDFDERARLTAETDEVQLGPDGQPLDPEGMEGDPGSTTGIGGTNVPVIVDIVAKVVAGEMSRESGKAILSVAFPITPEQAEEMLGPKDFEPPKPELPPGFPPEGGPPGQNGDPNNPFGGGPPEEEEEEEEEQGFPARADYSANQPRDRRGRFGSGGSSGGGGSGLAHTLAQEPGNQPGQAFGTNPAPKVSPFRGVRKQADIDVMLQGAKASGSYTPDAIRTLEKMHGRQTERIRKAIEKRSQKKVDKTISDVDEAAKRVQEATDRVEAAKKKFEDIRDANRAAGIAPKQKTAVELNSKLNGNIDKKMSASQQAKVRDYGRESIEHLGLKERWTPGDAVLAVGKLGRADGMYNLLNGRMSINQTTADNLKAYARDIANGRNYVSEMVSSAARVKRAQLIPDGVQRRQAMNKEIELQAEIRARVSANNVIIHESIHGKGRLGGAGYDGQAVHVEEVATEILSRKVVRGQLGAELSGHKQIPGTGLVGGAYDDRIGATRIAVQEVHRRHGSTLSVEDSHVEVEKAAQKFKSTDGPVLMDSVGVMDAFVAGFEPPAGVNPVMFKTDLAMAFQASVRHLNRRK